MLQVVSPYGPGAASTRVRVHEWLHRMDSNAYAVSSYLGSANARPSTIVKRPLATARAETGLRRLAHRRHERLLIHRQASPFSRGRIEASLFLSSALGVYDFDDALQWDHRGRLQDALFSNPAQCRRSVGSANRVIAGSDVLADWASQYCDDVRLIPSCVEPASYAAKTDYTRDGPLSVVWLGSPATEQYLAAVADALMIVAGRSGLRLTVISSGERSLGRLDPIVQRVAWDAVTFSEVLAGADVAVAPLADEPYARGKCAYKVLQYAAAGLPTIVSPIGANAVAAARLGFRTATTTDEWVDHLDELASSPALHRQRAGTEARRAVAAHYSFDAWQDAWTEAVGLPADSARGRREEVLPEPDRGQPERRSR